MVTLIPLMSKKIQKGETLIPTDETLFLMSDIANCLMRLDISSVLFRAITIHFSVLNDGDHCAGTGFGMLP